MCMMLAVGCESPQEKEAQALLAKAEGFKAANENTDALIAATDVELKYPKTKAAKAAAALVLELNARFEVEKKAAEEKQKKETERLERVAAKIAASKDALGKLKVRHDEMRNVTWYTLGPATGSRVQFYFGVFEKPGERLVLGPLHGLFVYVGDNWVFSRRVVVKAGDDLSEVEVEKWDRDTLGGSGVIEIGDVLLSPDHLDLAKKLAEAKTLKLRFDGQRYFDLVPSRGQLEALSKVYGIWQEIDASGAPAASN